MKTIIKINKKEIDSIIIFTFLWELDETNTEEVFKIIYKDLWDSKKKKIIFNFKWLKYLNSKSIWYIANLFLHITDNHWEMYISEFNKDIKDILELVWITKIIPTINNVEEAIKELKK